MLEGAGNRYRDRLLTVIAIIMAVAALRASYPITMPICFAAVIVAALWPLKTWLDRFLPSWLSYALAVLAFVVVLVAFAGAAYLSMGQMLAVVRDRWPAIEHAYNSLAGWADRRGVPLNAPADEKRVMGLITTLASGVYSIATYIGFVGLLVVLGLPEVARSRGKLHSDADGGTRRKTLDITTRISEQVRSYLGVTLATSVLTGLASAGVAFATGLDLALLWGLLNFLLNFIPVIGNLIGIVPPVLYALVQFDGWGMPAIVFVLFAAVQIAISNFIYPILQGRQLSLSPVAIIVAMTFWGWVWGIAGALIAVPLTAAIVIVCRHFDRSRWISELVSG